MEEKLYILKDCVLGHCDLVMRVCLDMNTPIEGRVL